MSIDAVLLKLRIIWGVLMASVVIYVVVAHVVDLSEQEAAGNVDLLRMVFAGLSLATAIAIPVLRRLKMPPQKAPSSVKDRIDEIPGALNAEVTTTYILAWALSESVCIYGLVLTFLSHEPSAILPYAAAALVLQVMNAPRRSVLEGVARAAR